MGILIILRPKKRVYGILILFRQFLKLYDRSSPYIFHTRGLTFYVLTPSSRKNETVDDTPEHLHYNNSVKDRQEPLSAASQAFKRILTNTSGDFHKALV